MKKSLIALAALAATASFAQSSVQIDGLVDAGYQANKYQGVSVTGFDGNGAGTTQINFRGTEDLGGGLKANFRMENDFSVVNNNANQGVVPAYAGTVANPTVGTPITTTTLATSASATNNAGVNSKFGNGELRVGLSGNFGAVNFGAINNGGLDFVSTVAPIQGTSFAGGYGVIIGADPAYGQVRWSNSGQYTTPTFSGFNASYIRANKQTNANTANANFYDAIGRYNILGADELTVRYNNGPLAAIYVYTQTDATGIGSGTKKKMNSLGASYAFGAAKVTAGYQTNKADDASYDRKAFTLGGFYTMGATTLFVQYGENKENAAASTFVGLKTKMTGIGADYALSKTTKLYARYEDVKDAAGILTMASLVGNDGSRNRVRTALGVRYNF